MTVRPRYTARMKARDLAAIYRVGWSILRTVAHAVTPPLRGLAGGVIAGIVGIITARYTDPR